MVSSIIRTPPVYDSFLHFFRAQKRPRTPRPTIVTRKDNSIINVTIQDISFAAPHETAAAQSVASYKRMENLDGCPRAIFVASLPGDDPYWLREDR